MSKTHQERKANAHHLFIQGQWAAALAEYQRIHQTDELEFKSFEPRSVILQEGDTGTSLFAIIDGQVDVVRHVEGKPPRTVAHMAKGDVFGEHALRSNAPRLASVVAATHTVVLELTREQVEQIIQLNPAVEHQLRSFHEERLVANLLRDNPHLSSLTAPQREALAKVVQLQVLPAGQRVLLQGQANENLYLILRGRCRVVHGFHDGREHPHPAMHEGDLFGELSTMLHLAVTATVVTDTRCKLLRLERAHLERLTAENTELREALFRLGSERLQRTARLMSGHN